MSRQLGVVIKLDC